MRKLDLDSVLKASIKNGKVAEYSSEIKDTEYGIPLGSELQELCAFSGISFKVSESGDALLFTADNCKYEACIVTYTISGKYINFNTLKRIC